jgi:SulP family sulfate permease
MKPVAWNHASSPSSGPCCARVLAPPFARDLGAGLIVGVLALPLAPRLRHRPGVKPEQGLFTAIVAGFVISALSGSRVQIGGPTGAFIVIVYSIVQRHGYDGLALATMMAGGLLVIMGLARLGTVIKFIPYPVTVGFTAGIALIILTRNCATSRSASTDVSRVRRKMDRVR